MSEQPDFDDVNEDGSVGGFDVQFTDVNGVRTRYYEEGADNDETLLLVHGGIWSGAWSANSWTPVIGGLSERFHVLAPDRLACGMTDNPTEESPYDWVFESELEHVRDFLDELGVDTCHACGSSRGMASLSWLADNYPGRIETLVIPNSNTLSPSVGDYGHRRTVLGRGEPTDEDSPTYELDLLRHGASVWAYDLERDVTEEFLRAQAYMQSRPKAQETAEVMAEGGKERIEREGKFAVMDDIRNRLRDGAISQPVLLYWGRNDLTAVLDQGLTLYEMLSQGNPNVRMHIVDRAGHHPFREFPEEFVRNVTTFADHWADNQRSMEEVRPSAYAEYYKSGDEDGDE